MRARSALILLSIAATLLAAAVFAAIEYRNSRPRFDPEALANYYTRASVRPAQPVDEGEVRSGIAWATDYIRRFTQPSGQFVYLVNMNPDVRVAPSYSLLRHAGTIYSLGMAHAVQPDETTVRVMQRSMDFLRRCCVTRLDEANAFGIWEPDEIMHAAAGPPAYKLGAAGLGLLAMVSLESIRPGSVPMEEMQGMAAFGRFLQRRSGEFDGAYVPSEREKTPLDALYYPGEMALGWLSLYELRPNPELVQAAVKALEFLARERAIEGDAPADHWALLATARLFALADRDKLVIPREALTNHALQICHDILDNGDARPLAPATEGALNLRGGVTPTATRLEGLLAALTFLPAEHPVRPHVESAVHRGIAFLLRAQVKEGEFAGGFPYAIMPLPADGNRDARRFNEQQTEIRIDYVQHSLSALVQYLWWISGHEGSARSAP